jgi:hypothetical protein
MLAGAPARLKNNKKYLISFIPPVGCQRLKNTGIWLNHVSTLIFGAFYKTGIL